MKINNSNKLICNYCRNYQLQTRKSGNCQMLGVQVEGRWQACPFYIAPFSNGLTSPHQINQTTNLNEIFQVETVGLK